MAGHDKPTPAPKASAAPPGRRTFLRFGAAGAAALAGGLGAAPGALAAPRRSGVVATVADGCPMGKDAAEMAAGARAGAAATATSPGPVAAAAARSIRPAPARLCGRVYLNRAAWGADESLRFDANGAEVWPPVFWPLQTITVHHTATALDPDPAAHVRAIYRNQAVGERFGDIGYHALIDEAGRIYEARWSGEGSRVPGFDAEGRLVNAAHVQGFNAGNYGVALLGDLTAQGPTRAAYTSLVALLARITEAQDVDPLGGVHYVNPISGAVADVRAIAGHRDWAPTQCPGNTFYPTLEALRRGVAR